MAGPKENVVFVAHQRLYLQPVEKGALSCSGRPCQVADHEEETEICTETICLNNVHVV